MKRAVSRSRKRHGEMTMATLGGLLLLAAAAVVLFMLWSPINAVSEQSTEDAACSLSVKLASNAATRSITELKCPTRQVEVRVDGSHESSLREKKSRVTTSLEDARRKLVERGIAKPTQEQILEELGRFTIAQQMATCWNRFGEGQSTIFSGGWFVSDTHCVSCAVIHFSDEYVSAIQTSTFADFPAYLQSIKRSNDGPTYFDYLRPPLKGLSLRLIGSRINVDIGNTAIAQDIDLTQRDFVVTFKQLGDLPTIAKSIGTDVKASGRIILWPITDKPSCDVLY